MRIFKPYRSKIRSTLVTWILLISVLVTPLLVLVQPTSSPTPWWNSDWYFRKLITLNHTFVKGELQNFPVLIDIVDNDLRDKAQLDGDDIVFIDNDNNTLSHEIESYDSSSGHLTVWVKIPLLHSDTDTTFYMYYGNPDAINKQDSSAVWDHNFVMVQHMEESYGKRFDSTRYGNNGTLYGEVNKDHAGKIDGADTFNTNGYIRVPEGFLPNFSITVELWLKPSSYSSTIWTKFVNTGPATTSGIYGSQSSKNKDAWTLGLSWDSATKRFNTGSITSNYTWNYIAITWNGTYCIAYHNGEIIEEEAVSGVPDWAGRPFYLGSNFKGRELFNGTLDEIRISDVARSTEWIQTSYNNLDNPSAFYTIGEEQVCQDNFGATFICQENPWNGATDVYTNPTLSIHVIANVSNPNGQNMTIIFREKVFNTWVEIKRYENVLDGTYNATPNNMKNLGTTYYWSVNIIIGKNSTSKTFYFTTTTKILKEKWVASNVPQGVSGVLIADIDGDGIDDVVHAGDGEVVALNGTDGSVLWEYPDSDIDWWTQPQMADLNRDGILEIVVPLNYPAGLLVLHANNGSLYWRRQDLGKETYSSPIICDIDGNGYPTIFATSSDITEGLHGTGRLTSLSYNGTILHQTFTWRPCAGGLSIADTDRDGEFELYMSDRHMYMADPEYGDNDYGKGVQSFWAKNLTLRWSHPDILCSSQIPMLADVTGDGVLDVIIGDLSGGIAVLNSTHGSIIRRFSGGLRVTPTHYQPSVCDIDGDGNLELLMADPHNDPNEPTGTDSSDDIIVWDLVDWKVDTRIYIGKCYYGPQVADVTGDGIMEIVACNFRGIFIIDRTYRIIDGITGLHGKLNYAVAQDIDGDGYIELVVSSQGGYIYAFDTPARTPNPKPRTEVQFYSEYRRGVAEYVPPPTCQEPVISNIYPLNGETEVSLSLSELLFTLTDYQGNLMNYTVKTYPNIGSGNGTNVTNGKYILNITKLTPSTTYIWTINVTDGNHWTNKTFVFTAEDIFPWWNISWNHRKKIIFDHTKVGADLSNFPVLIDITDSDLAKEAQPLGEDIVFTDVYGTKLNHEIELYDNATGHLIAWVNVPLLSSATDTIIYMYYDNSDAENQQRPSLVWDNNYVLVQHFEEISGVRYDSTNNGNNATPYGEIDKSFAGKIDGADTFNTSSYERIQEDFLPTSAITVELWFKPLFYSPIIWTKFINTGPTTTSGIYGGQASKTKDLWALGLTWDNATKRFVQKFESDYVWNYLVITWDGEYCSAYLNGIKVQETMVSGVPDWAGRPFYLGSNFKGRELFNGTLDEIRISDVARSTEWIQTSYNNLENPSNFYTIGGEESIPEAPMVFAPSPKNRATNISPSLQELSFNLTDYQGDKMNYTVSTYPNIGSGNGINVTNGRYGVPVSDVKYFVTYKWTVSVTDGKHWTNVTYTFTTLPTEPPTQGDPILVSGEGGNIICYNQTTYDHDGDKVTNIYNWYRNNTPTTNVLMAFETNSSTTVKDYSGYNNNGIIVGAVTWVNDGKVGCAYKFERGFIQVPGSNTLDGGGQWSEITVEHWIYLTTSQSNTRTIAKIPSYEIGITGNKLFASIWTATGNPMVSGHNMITYDTPLELNAWHHVVLTYKKGEALTLYVNGVAVATKTPLESTTLNYNIQPSGTMNPLYIGWFDYFKGVIDEVRIYPRSLSPQQIYQRYIETKDGLTNSSTIVSQETKIGEIWRCEVTPNDSYQDGATKSSNSITIGFADNFNDNSTNTEFWKTLQKNNGTVSETNGRVECTVPSGKGTAGYITKQSYDLSDSYIQIDVSNQHLCEAALAITLDGINDHFWYSNNFYVIEKHRWSLDQPDNFTLKIKKRIDGGDRIYLYNGSWTGPTGTLAIEIENGVIYFYEDGILRYSEPYELSSYNCYIHFEANTWDTNYNGTDYFDNFILLNNKPSAKDLTIMPLAPKTTDDLIGNYTFFDPDGDPENGTEIRWYKNDVLQPNLNDTLVVPHNLTTKGEIWHFTVRPSDGKEFGATYVSPHVLIQNSPPTINYFTPTNTTLEINETETINFTHTSSDPDNDTMTYSWLLDGIEQSTAQNWTYTTDYDSSGTRNVTLVVYDTELATAQQQWTVIIHNVNRPPEASNLTITPSNPLTTDDLVANYTYYDIDGDPENGTEILWYKNGTLQPQLNGTLTVLSNQTAKGETWYFTVKPKDGEDFGELKTSPNVTIQNSPPQIVNLTITPNPAYTNDTLTANLTTFDPDGDNVTITYQWQKYNTTEGVWYNITGATNQTLGPENFNKTDQIKVICTPYDGENYGISQEANITISNSAPIISSYYPDYDPTINLTEVQEFNLTYYDIDGDSLIIQWYVNETLKDEWTGNASVLFQPDQTGIYIIKVVVSDGQDETLHQWTLTVEE